LQGSLLQKLISGEQVSQEPGQDEQPGRPRRGQTFRPRGDSWSWGGDSTARTRAATGGGAGEAAFLAVGVLGGGDWMLESLFSRLVVSTPLERS
jgi:hypothetical protein